MTRREFSLILAAGAAGCAKIPTRRALISIATFKADVTPPLGHPLMGGGIAPAARIATPLTIRGFVLSGPEQPVVFAAIDWCEIRNESYAQWQRELAQAAGATPERVLLTSVHVHDAPITDIRAQQLLTETRASGQICDLQFHDEAIRRSGAAVREALQRKTPVTHLTFGAAQVEDVASNRRFIRANGQISFGRSSSTPDPEAHAAPAGLIDPFLKQITFWDEQRPVASLSSFAVHPMSTYGRGAVSWDFVGDARSRLEALAPDALHIYSSGCSGNVTAGKYNDGGAERRRELATRLYEGMKTAWENSRTWPLRTCEFRSEPVYFQPRTEGLYSPEGIQKRLAEPTRPFDQCLAAMTLSWQERLRSRPVVHLSALDLGPVAILLLPAESYVEFQLHAQKVLPNKFVLTCGYGECAPGYIPTEQAWAEGDSNLGDWCWVARGSEKILKTGIERLLL